MCMKEWICAGVVLTVSVAPSAEEKAAFSLTSDFYSKYVWRGHNLVDDWVWQPSVGISKGPWSAGVWGNLDLTNENSQAGEFTEYDFYGSYSLPLADNLSLSVGYIYYRFPGAGSTQEVYSGLSLDTFLSPSLTVYYDFDDINGTYVSAGIGHTIEKIAELSESVPVGLALSCAVGWGDSNYNEGYWADTVGDPLDKSALNDLSLKIAFPFTLGKWTVTPSLNYVMILDSDIRNGLPSGDRDLFWTGVGLGTEF